MTHPRPAVSGNFDRIARPYRFLEHLTFGGTLERCRSHFLPNLVTCRRALVLGDGDGRFLAALLASNPHVEADAVDASEAMLLLLRRRAAALGAERRIRTHHGNALTFAPQGSYDLVVTHFFLDCLTQPELDSLCARLAPHVSPRAQWVFSDFRIPAGPMRLPARSLVRTLYLAFRLLTGLRTTTLPDHTAALTAAGLRRIAHHPSLGGLLTAELWQLTWSSQDPRRSRITLRSTLPPCLPPIAPPPAPSPPGARS